MQIDSYYRVGDRNIRELNFGEAFLAAFMPSLGNALKVIEAILGVQPRTLENGVRFTPLRSQMR